MKLHLDASPEELQVFLAENEELLQSLEEALVEMEREGPTPELIQPLFRVAHTIKGSAGAIGHTRMAALTHAMETLMDRVRRGELRVTSDLIERLFKALDMLRLLTLEVERGEQSDLDISALAHALESWSGDAVPAPTAAAPASTSLLPPPDGATHLVRLRFDDGPWVAVRGLQALIAAEESGEILASLPTRAQVEAQEINEELQIWIQTDVSLEELHASFAAVPETTVIGIQDTETILRAEGLGVSAPPRTAAASRLTDLLPPPGGATHHVVLQFDEGPWVAVRGLQALIAAEEVGEILVSQPTRAQIEAQEINERLELWIQTEAAAEAVEHAFAAVPETRVVSLLETDAVLAATSQREEVVAAAVGEPTPAEGTESRRPVARSANTTVRIDVARLDMLLNLVGELVIDRTRLSELCRSLREQVGEHRLLEELGETTLHLARITDELQGEVMKSRMLPIGTVFSRFPRVVRDLAVRQKKNVDLVIEGQETELDRSVIEEIGDPLVHLLRNAVDHGMDLPEERTAAGKPGVGIVRLAAEHVENSIVITVEDDGRGIDTSRVKARAVERGIITQDAADRMSEQEAVELIFAPGFSTAKEVSDISGRGVGMDIVRTNVEKLGGTVEVHTSLGKGSRFLLRLPLTLAIVQTLLVRVTQGVYAIPLTSVTETLRVPLGDIQRVQNQEAILLRGRVLPIVRLTRMFGCADDEAPDGHNLLVVAVKVGERQVGLVVDELLGEQELVIKALGEVVGDVPGISSAAIMGDGSVALIVDVPGLVQRVAQFAERNQDSGGLHERELVTLGV